MSIRTLYLEADEDITSAIDKLNKIEEHEVRVVVPQRSTLLASMINLKLLKKACSEAKKKLVLVTTDDTVINLASRVGLAVAENLKADAEVPDVKDEPVNKEPDVIEESDPAPAPTPEPEAVAAAAEPAFSRKEVKHEEPVDKPAKAKKSRVPNFDGVQKKALLGALVVGGLVVLLGLNFFFKKADITVFAKGTAFPTDIKFRAVDGSGDPEAGSVGSELLTKNDQLSGDFNATGEKDEGTKAHGTITIKNCEDTNAHTMAAGTKVTASGKSFTTNAAASIPAGSFSGGGTVCNSSTVSTSVTATANGDSYNLAPTSYSAQGFSSNFRITGNQMSGGTSKIVKIVSSGDIAKAKAKLIAEKKEALADELSKQASSSQIVVKDSVNTKVNSATATPAQGEEGDSFSLTMDVDFTLRALDKSDLEALIQSELEGKIGEDNQIYNSGLDKAEIKASDASGEFNLSADVSVGTKMDVEAMKKSIRGKKLGEASSELGKIPGVERTEISLWPFWVSHVSRLSSRINIDIKIENPTE